MDKKKALIAIGALVLLAILSATLFTGYLSTLPPPMSGWPWEPCDNDRDGDCDDVDDALVWDSIGTCGDGTGSTGFMGYNALADLDHDSCVSIYDQIRYFPERIPLSVGRVSSTSRISFESGACQQLCAAEHRFPCVGLFDICRREGILSDDRDDFKQCHVFLRDNPKYIVENGCTYYTKTLNVPFTAVLNHSSDNPVRIESPNYTICTYACLHYGEGAPVGPETEAFFDEVVSNPQKQPPGAPMESAS